MRRQSKTPRDADLSDFSDEPTLEEADEFGRVRPTMTTSLDNRLWESYEIKPQWPLRLKVERLKLVYRLSAKEIAEALEMTVDEVNTVIQAIEEEWQELGRPLDPAAKQVERGRLLINLQRMLADLEMLDRGHNDPRVVQLRLAVHQQISNLQELGPDKRDIGSANDPNNPITYVRDKLKELDPAKLQAMLEALKQFVPEDDDTA